MKHRLASIGWTYTIMLLLLPISLSWGQSTQQYKRTARFFYRQGKGFAVKKQFKKAIKLYIKALNILRVAEKKTPKPKEKKKLRQSQASFLYIIGRTYEFDGQPKKAIEHYRQCITSMPKQKVELQAKKYMTALQLKYQATIVINSVPSGARVALSDTTGAGQFGKTPFLAQINSGRIRVKVSLSGYQTVDRWFTLRAGMRSKHSFRLKVVVKKTQTSRMIAKKSRSAAALARKKKNQSSINTKGWRRTAGYSAVGIGGLSLILSATLLGMAASDFGEANKMVGNAKFTTTQIVQRTDSGYGKQNAGIAALVVGLIGGTAAIVFFITSRPPASPNSSRSPASPEQTSIRIKEQNIHTFYQISLP